MSSADGRAPFIPLDHERDEWLVWRWACVRGAGFSTTEILKLAASDAARAADDLDAAHDETARAFANLADALVSDFSHLTPEAITGLRRARKKALKQKVPSSEDLHGVASEELAAAESATARLAEFHTRYAQAFATAREEIARALAETAASPMFREALAWQNRAALETALARLVRPTGPANSSVEKKRSLVASYLQRYCTKNDTIGFFGPVGWAELTEERLALAVEPGPGLVSTRKVYFEQWAIDVLAKKICEDVDLEPWFLPRRFPFVRVEGNVATSATTGRHELSAFDAELLASCNGITLASEIAARAVRGGAFAKTEDVFAALRALARRELIAFALEVPLTWEPDETLRRILARVDDDARRTRAVAMLDELTSSRARLAAAVGDPEAVIAALEELEATFTHVTGAPATRHAGMMYAARQVVFEDCRRDIHVRLGRKVVDEIAPALSLVLASARWMTYETARAYGNAMRELYEVIATRRGTRAVEMTEYWFHAQRVFHGTANRLIDGVVAELTKRWALVLGTFADDVRHVELRASDLRATVEELFSAPGPGWTQARTHSPDLMIVASSVDAIERGELRVVLGELHVGVNTLSAAAIAAQHPALHEVDEAFASICGEDPIVMPVASKEWPRTTTRAFTYGLPPATTWFLETGVDPAPGGRERALALGDLVIEDVGGRLLVHGPHGFEMEVAAFFGEVLSTITLSAFRLFEPRTHTPRIMIDKLVVARETWRFSAAGLALTKASSAEERFLEARCWARATGVPRMFFVKSPVEVKPVFVDLDSPTLVSRFAKLARAAADHPSGTAVLTISEMLPALTDAWLPDARDRRYTSELRIVALDRKKPPG